MATAADVATLREQLDVVRAELSAVVSERATLAEGRAPGRPSFKVDPLVFEGHREGGSHAFALKFCMQLIRMQMQSHMLRHRTA